MIRAILKAPVDLIFFGGIGTYVRASAETDEAVGDRANDRGPHHRRRYTLQGDRGGRQSRHDAARPRRGGAARHQAQYRRHRQLGRREYLRRRGQSQDRAGDADARRPALARGPQCAPCRHDRRRGGAGAAQQLSAAAGDLARRAARARGSRLRAAPDADAGNRAASSIAPSSSCPTTWRSPSAGRRSQALTRPELAVLLAYAKLVAPPRAPAIERAGRSLSRPRARPLFPRSGHRAIPRCGRAPSAAARHHRHAARQFHDQSRRPFAAGAHRRSDRRLGGEHRRRLCRRARQLRHDRAQWRDRRARQQDLRQAAARALSGGAGSAARPAGLVPAQRRSRRRGSPPSSRIIATALQQSRPSLDDVLPEAAAAARREREAELRRDGVPDELARRLATSAGARRRARYRDGRRPRRPEYRRGRGHLFRRRSVLPSRPASPAPPAAS